MFGCVQVTVFTANFFLSDVEAARRFYGEYLRLGVEEMNLGWVARYRTEDGRASVQVVTRDATRSAVARASRQDPDPFGMTLWREVGCNRGAAPVAPVARSVRCVGDDAQGSRRQPRRPSSRQERRDRESRQRLLLRFSRPGRRDLE